MFIPYVIGSILSCNISVITIARKVRSLKISKSYTQQIQALLDLVVTTVLMSLLACFDKLVNVCVDLWFLQTKVYETAVFKCRQRIVVVGVRGEFVKDLTPLNSPELARVEFKVLELGIVSKESVELPFPVCRNVSQHQRGDRVSRKPRREGLEVVDYA